VNRAAYLLVISLLLAACGGTAAPPRATPGAPTAAPAEGSCFLLTDAEVGAAMDRQPIQGGTGFELGGVRHCNWITWMDPLQSVGIQLGGRGLFDDGEVLATAPVSGIGDEAFWTGDLGMLYVRRGDRAMLLAVTHDSRTRERAVQLARLAVPRLP
jgi:hypothetical protein